MIKLGERVKDLSSGFAGITTSVTVVASGNIRFGVQPMSEKGDSIPQAYELDHHLLVTLDAGISHLTTEASPKLFKIGEEVEDIVTGFKGYITAVTTYINGCHNYLLEARKNSDERYIIEAFLQDRLRLTGETPLSFKASNTADGKPSGSAPTMSRQAR